MNILLVDDETTMLEILQKVIDWPAIGIKKVFTAKNAGEAKTVLQKTKIDITLCDIEMPKESGLELIEWIQEFYPSIINIILTGHAKFTYARDAISLGVYRFLLKPVSFEEVEQTIKAAVEKAEMEYLNKQVNETNRQEECTAADEIKRYLESNYSKAISRSDLEELVHLNGDYINRIFKEATGYTLMEYIKYYRVCVAKKLLRETQASIAQICISIGYDHPAYFSKIFKMRTGMSPSEYRNSQENIKSKEMSDPL